MRTRTLTWAVALGAMMGVAACGGDSSDELMRIHTQDTLDFRMDASDSPEHVFPIEASWVVYRDGSGTETVVEPAPGRAEAIEASPRQLEELERLLARLDVESLERHFGTEAEGDGTTTLTYRGRSTTVDSRVMALNPGPAPPGTRPFPLILTLLNRIADPPPGGHGNRERGRVGAEPSR